MTRKTTTFLIALALPLAACSDSSGPDSTNLTRAEALSIASVILSSGETATTESSASQNVSAPAGVDAVPIEFTHQVQSSHPCPAGGTVAFDLVMDGTADDETGSFAFTLGGSQTHNDCAFPHQGLTITVDGDPDLQFTASAAMTDNLPSAPFTFGVEGGFTFVTSDGRSGECLVSIDAVTDFNARQRTLSAQVCGHSINQTTSWN